MMLLEFGKLYQNRSKCPLEYYSEPYSLNNTLSSGKIKTNEVFIFLNKTKIIKNIIIYDYAVLYKGKIVWVSTSDEFILTSTLEIVGK